MTTILPNDVKVYRETWDITQPNQKPVEIGEAIFVNNLLDTIELLAKELARQREGVKFFCSMSDLFRPIELDTASQAWVEWGKAHFQA